MMIAFVGSDGSGKSTLTRDIEKWLRYKLDAHTFYMGSGDGGVGLFDILRRGIKGLVRSIGARKKKKENIHSKKTKAIGFVSKLAQLHQLVVMRHKVRLLRLARRMLQKGSVIITDRYPQSQFYGISDGPKLQDGRSFLWAARAELKLYEEASRLGPDLLLKLSIDPQTAHRRKPDHDLSVIERKCAIIDQLSFSQSRVVVIDARQPYGDVLLGTKRAIWSALRGNQA
jgi:thymidylate kinase